MLETKIFHCFIDWETLKSTWIHETKKPCDSSAQINTQRTNFADIDMEERGSIGSNVSYCEEPSGAHGINGSTNKEDYLRFQINILISTAKPLPTAVIENTMPSQVSNQLSLDLTHEAWDSIWSWRRKSNHPCDIPDSTYKAAFIDIVMKNLISNSSLATSDW